MLYSSDLELPPFFDDLKKSIPFKDDSVEIIMLAIKSAYQIAKVEKKDFLLPIASKNKLVMYVVPSNHKSEVLGYEMGVQPIPFVRDIEIMMKISEFSKEYNLHICPKVSQVFCSSMMTEDLIPEIIFGTPKGEAH